MINKQLDEHTENNNPLMPEWIVVFQMSLHLLLKRQANSKR